MSPRSVAATVARLEPLLLAALALPLLFPTPARALAMLGLPLLWAARRYATGHFVRRTPLDWAILLFLVMVLVSLYATFDVAFSLPKLTGVLLGVAVYYATVAATPSLGRVHLALALFFAVGSGVAALSLVGSQWILKSPLLSPIIRRLPSLVRGLPGAESGFHPNEVAGTLIWFVPLQLALLARLRRMGWPARLLLLGSLLLTGGTLVLTQSRSGWLAMLVALAAMGAIVSRPLRAAAALLVILGLVLLIVAGPTAVGDWLFGEQTQEFTGTFTLSFRLQVWRAGLWGAADFPFTGMGLGTFRQVARLLYPLPISADYDIAHAHNHFLQAALDLGLPGLVAYIALWLGAGYLLVQAYRATRDNQLRALALGLGGGMLAYFVYGLTDAVALGAKPGVVLWLTLGLVVAVHRLALGYPIPSQISNDQLAPDSL